MTTPTRVVVTDANVLINLLHVARLEKCSRVPGLELVVPNHVWEEISYPAERAVLDDALVRGIVRIEEITDPKAVELFAELVVHLGRGESACLAIAVDKGWMIASDEKRRFRREAMARIGADRLSVHLSCSCWPSKPACSPSKRPTATKRSWKPAASRWASPPFATS